MTRRIPPPSAPGSNTPVGAFISRRRSSLPSEPMNTPGLPVNLITRAVRTESRFARDTFLHSDGVTEYRTSAPPMTNSQQVFINTDIVLSSADYPDAPCYFLPEDPSMLVLRQTFPAQSGDYIVIRYVTTGA